MYICLYTDLCVYAVDVQGNLFKSIYFHLCSHHKQQSKMESQASKFRKRLVKIQNAKDNIINITSLTILGRSMSFNKFFFNSFCSVNDVLFADKHVV